MNVNLNLHQLYTTATGKVAISYVSYIHYHMCVHIHVAAVVCRDPPLSIKGKALTCVIKAEENLTNTVQE